jgi:uncharacterized protein (DUF1919 family)
MVELYRKKGKAREKMKKLIRKIQFKLRDFFINRKYRKRLKNKDFSIISCDCIGGCIYKDLKMQFLSPTVNMYIGAADFVTLAKNLKEFATEGVLSEYHFEGCPYPLVNVSTPSGKKILLFCLHYKRFDEVKNAWERRMKRINLDNVFLILSEGNGFSESVLKDFDALPYENKVCFVSKPMPEYKSAYYLEGFNPRDNERLTLSYVKKLGLKRYYDQFDFVSWLNG